MEQAMIADGTSSLLALMGLLDIQCCAFVAFRIELLYSA